MYIHKYVSICIPIYDLGNENSNYKLIIFNNCVYLGIFY